MNPRDMYEQILKSYTFLCDKHGKMSVAGTKESYHSVLTALNGAYEQENYQRPTRKPKPKLDLRIVDNFLA